MEQLHIASKPLLELLQESVALNLGHQMLYSAMVPDLCRLQQMRIHIDELREMNNHLLNLLKDSEPCTNEM